MMTPAQAAGALARAAATIERRMVPVVNRAGVNVASDARTSLQSGNPTERYAGSHLGFDRGDAEDLDVAVGYSDIPDSVARAVEYGGSNSGPGGQLRKAARTEAPRFAEVSRTVAASVWR